MFVKQQTHENRRQQNEVHQDNTEKLFILTYSTCHKEIST